MKNASSPPLSASVLRDLERQIIASDEAALAELHTQLHARLGEAREASNLAALSAVLRLLGLCAAKMHQPGETTRFIVQSLRGFGLLGEERAYLRGMVELVELLSVEAPEFTTKLEFFEDLRQRIRRLLGQWVEVTRPRTGEGKERTSQLFVTDTEMVGYFDGEGAIAGPPQVNPNDAPEALIAGLVARLLAGLKKGRVIAPIQHMIARLELNPLETGLLLILHAGQSDPFVRRAYTFAWNDFSQKIPDLSFLSGLLFGPPKPIWSLMQRLLSPGAPLLHYELARRRSTDGGLELVQLTSSALRLLDGAKGLPIELGEWCQDLDVSRYEGVEDAGTPDLERLLKGWVKHEAKVRGHRFRVLLRGSAPNERRRAVEIACARTGLGMIRADLTQLRHRSHEVLFRALSILAREASLSNRVVLIEVPTPPRDEHQQQTQGANLSSAISQGLKLFSGPVLLSLEVGAEVYLPNLPGALEVEVVLLNTEGQIRTWAQTLERYQIPAPPVDQLKAVAERFPLGADAIEEATRELWVRTTLLDETPSPDTLITAAGRKMRHAMGSIAQRVSMSLSWADVVLPKETEEQLHEIVAFARHRNRVLDDWGFRSKLPYGRALSALFYGPPGTGKTMMAGIIARDLGMELFRIDLSQVVSKYIGETEKNLARAFDEATRNHAVLLFDEADSLFAKRTEVKSSNDRNANLEVNFLLQRMEDFEGVTILTTNIEKSIDDAFKRRIRFKVEFPFPEEDQRTDLWKVMIPEAAELEGNIYYEHLGADFKMSGGSIKNAVLRAAFIAATREKAIGFDELWLAGTREYTELGHLVREHQEDDM